MGDGVGLVVLAVVIAGAVVVLSRRASEGIEEARRTREVLERVDRDAGPLLRAGGRVVGEAERLGIL